MRKTAKVAALEDDFYPRHRTHLASAYIVGGRGFVCSDGAHVTWCLSSLFFEPWNTTSAWLPISSTSRSRSLHGAAPTAKLSRCRFPQSYDVAIWISEPGKLALRQGDDWSQRFAA